MGKKMIAAAIVAVFFATAFVGMIGESDAADKKTYEIYVEVVESNGVVSVEQYFYFEAEATPESFVEAGNKAFKDGNMSDLSMSIKESGMISLDYHGGSNATYYANGTEWVDVVTTQTDYVENTKLAFAVQTGFISSEIYDALSEADKNEWKDTTWGDPWHYKKKIGISPAINEIREYEIFCGIIDDDLVTYNDVDDLKFTSEAEPEAWVSAINQTLSGLNSPLSKLVVTYTPGFIGLVYDGSFNNASFYKDGGSWKEVGDTVKQYLSGDKLDFELDNGFITKEQYDGLNSAEKKLWLESTGMPGYYVRDPVGDLVDKALDILIIAGIVILLIIIVVVVLVVLHMRKRGQQSA